MTYIQNCSFKAYQVLHNVCTLFHYIKIDTCQIMVTSNTCYWNLEKNKIKHIFRVNSAVTLTVDIYLLLRSDRKYDVTGETRYPTISMNKVIIKMFFNGEIKILIRATVIWKSRTVIIQKQYETCSGQIFILNSFWTNVCSRTTIPY